MSLYIPPRLLRFATTILTIQYLHLHLGSIDDAKAHFIATVLFLLAWATLCAFGAQELRALAAADPGGVEEQWLEDIDNCKTAVWIVGTLFVFTLVFRFNACYDRWWEGRIHWVSCLVVETSICI